MTRSDLGKMFARICKQWFLNSKGFSPQFEDSSTDRESARDLVYCGLSLRDHRSEAYYPSLEVREQFYKVLDAAWKWHENSPDFWRECECDMCQVHREVRALRELIESGLEKAEKAEAS